MEKSKRILAIDLARGISSFCIPMAHVLLIYGTDYTQGEDWLGLVVHFFGKWAGIFLLAMGFSYTLSSNNTVGLSIKRGIYLLGIGYFMNFLKFVIPHALGLFPDNFIEAYGWTPPLTINNLVYMVLTGDILQLAGFSLLLMGIINKFALKNKFIPLFVTIAMVILLEFVRGIRIGNFVIDYFLDILWGESWNVYFSIFPWFGYILVGMFFGYWFKEVQKDAKFIFNQMLLYGLVTTVIGGVLCYVDYDFHMRDYFHLGIGGFIYLLGYNLIVFGIFNKLSNFIDVNGRVIQFLIYCSKRITTMYVIQWVLIMLGMGLFGYHSKTTTEILPLMLLFTVLTLIVQKVFDACFVKSL